MIRWITPQLGTAPWEQAQSSSDVYVLDVRDLVDRTGNYPSDVKLKIDDGVRQLAADKRVVICCDYGISRSIAIAAGIIAVSGGITLDDALAGVLQATGEDSMKLEVLTAVRRALEPAGPRLGSSGAVLVTGGTGFIGQKLLSALGDGAAAIAPGRDEVDLTGPSFPLDRLVREREVGTLVHLAHPRILTANRSLGEAITAMKNVLDVCGENGLRLVYLSSWEVFSGYRSPRPLMADEDLRPQPGGTYGYGKALCESLMDEVAHQVELPWCLLRTGPVFGEESDRPRFIRTFVGKAQRNEPIVVHRYRNGLPRLDLVPASVLVSGLVAAIDKQATGIFHLGSGSPISTTELAERVVRVLGSVSPIITKDIDADFCNVIMDSGKARTELDWETAIDLGGELDELITYIGRSDRSPGATDSENGR